MKKLNINFNFLAPLILMFVTIITGCEFEETDFGMNGSIKGEIKDTKGNVVYGDVLVNDIVVNLLGEGDKQPIQIRVQGDGTFQNTKIFPKNHKIWVEGPVIFTDTINNDFSDDANLEKDFILTPFISPEVISATVNGTSIDVEYLITANAGKTVSKSAIYCSTAKYPTGSVGSYGVFYSTKTVNLTSLSGTKNVSGLTSGERYYVRIGSQAAGSTLWNYSNQVEVTIP